jgi:hypothetical protein
MKKRGIKNFIYRYRKTIPAFAGMTMLLLFSFWLMTHTFSYDGQTHAIRVAFKLWSDFGAHIPLIRSFSMGSNFPNPSTHAFVQYPIFPGERIRYHFLYYMGVGLLERIGVRIDWALNVPSALGFFALTALLYILAKRLFRSTAVGVLSVVFFLFNGSLGFLRFFSLHPLSTHTLSDIIKASAFPAFAPWGKGEITAFWNLNIYTNQRHLAIAFALILLFILRTIRNTKWTLKQNILSGAFWGCVFGLLPYFHQPTLLILAIFMGYYFLVYPNKRVSLCATAIVTTLLVVPQMALTGTGAHTVQWYPGYIIHNELIAQKQLFSQFLHMASFWWQNVGLHSILILVGFFFLPGRIKKVLFPIWVLFLVPNLFKFSVEASANHKFFNFVMILGQMISAYVLVSVFKAIYHRFHHWITHCLLLIAYCLLLIVLTLTGIIDFFVIYNDTKGSIPDIPANEVAAWIAANTPTSAIFLNSSYLYHPASLAGRPIFLGWPYFPWSAGYRENRMPIMDTMYETRNTNKRCSLLSRYQISYVTVEDVKNDTNLPKIDYAYFREHFTPVYVTKDDSYAIYTTEALCQ